MSQQELIETAEAVAGLIPRLARGLTSAERDPADDLPLAQLRLCGILSEGPRPMSAVSRELGVSLSALTQIADRLERAGLVKRVAGGSDRRVRCLQLTARGEKLTRKRREARVLRTLAVLEHLSAQQCEAVQASLEVLVNACSAVQVGTALEAAAEGSCGQTEAANGHANHHHAETPVRKDSKSKVSPHHSGTPASKGPKSRVTL